MSAAGNVFRKRVSDGALAMVVFATTIFISAALLFLIEPMFAKFVLPSFGGTPAMWTGSMMFFQATLLTSYLYVHLTTTWLGARRQAVLHLAIVGLPLLLFLLTGPIDVPAEKWAPASGDNPLLALLALLFVAIGLPFFAVSATNPLIQRWLADTDHPSARDPYFLYMASNAGSVIGLLGYPLLVEPSLNLDDQGVFWTVGYGLLMALVVASAVDTNAEENPNKLASIYTVMARDEADLGNVPTDERWQPCATDARGVWTNGFSNLLSTFE